MQIEMTSYIYFCPEDEVNFVHFVRLFKGSWFAAVLSVWKMQQI